MTAQRARNKAAPVKARQAVAEPHAQKIIVRDMTLSCAIGITKDERARPQRLRLNLEVEVVPERPSRDKVDEVVHYGHLAQKLRDVCAGTGAQLLETLAQELAEACCFDPRVRAVRIRIEKLDRYADMGGIGVEINFRRGPS